MDAKTAGALVFWGLAVFTVVPAFMLLVVRDVIRCSMLLLATLSGMAGLFVVLGADFLGFVQVLVYIGGILILLMYGVMLTERDPVLLERRTDRALIAPAMIAAIFLALPSFYVALALGVGGSSAAVAGAAPTHTTVSWHTQAQLPEPTTSSREIGELLMTDYVLPFEVVSLLLLAALIGAAYIARMGGDGEAAG